jgi:hypothetical protein
MKKEECTVQKFIEILFLIYFITKIFITIKHGKNIIYFNMQCIIKKNNDNALPKK